MSGPEAAVKIAEMLIWFATAVLIGYMTFVRGGE
jgi:hypothetical protein